MSHQPIEPTDTGALARWGIQRGNAPGLRGRDVRRAAPRWTLDELSGRFVELSGEGAAAWLTLSFSLVVDAQRRGEPVAWITDRKTTFFPPDASANGVDLAALPVIFTADAPAAARSAERLARSGAFGLLVLDLVGVHEKGRPGQPGQPNIPAALQSRLAGLAGRHETTIVCLTEKPAGSPSLGAMVSLRGDAQREAREHLFACRVDVTRDKRRAGRWTDIEVCHGPAGLC